MIKAIRPLPEHLDLIKPKSVYLDNPFLKEELIATLNQHSAVTLTKNGVVIAIVGIVRLTHHTAEVWAITSDLVKKCPIEFHRKVDTLLDTYLGLVPIKRLQMAVRSDFTEGQRWAESLGFSRETLMKNYGSDGKDYYLYGRVI